MKTRMPLLLLFICLQSAAQEPIVPDEVKPFVLPGYEVLDLKKADLNRDKKTDYLLILKIAGEDSLPADSPDWDATRPLLLLTRQTSGTLATSAVSNELVHCKHCGGMMGDPYQGMTVKPGEFTLEFYGGSSWRWGEQVNFRYDAIQKNWFLHSQRTESFQSGDPENTHVTTIITRSEAGDIPLTKYTPHYNADSSSWRVSAAKTFFYDSPSLQAKPRKAFLLKEDEVISFRQFRNFIECSFTNSKGTTTTGYILKKDLQLLKSRKPATLN